MSEQNPKTEPPGKEAFDNLFKDIEKVAQAEVSSARTDEALVKVETETLKSDQLKIENERLRDELERAKDIHSIRKTYISRLFWLIVFWLLMVVIFVTLAASNKDAFSLSDKVLIAFITSTTVSVLGLFVVVAKWLYPSVQKEEVTKKREVFRIVKSSDDD